MFDCHLGLVNLPRYWRRDIIVRGICCGTASLLNFVQIDSRFFFCLGVDPYDASAELTVTVIPITPATLVFCTPLPNYSIHIAFNLKFATHFDHADRPPEQKRDSKNIQHIIPHVTSEKLTP